MGINGFMVRPRIITEAMRCDYFVPTFQFGLQRFFNFHSPKFSINFQWPRLWARNLPFQFSLIIATVPASGVTKHITQSGA